MTDDEESRAAYVRNLAEQLYIQNVFSNTTTTAGTTYQYHARACFDAAEAFVQVESEKENEK